MTMRGAHTFTGGFRESKTERMRETEVKLRKQLDASGNTVTEEIMLFTTQVLFALSITQTIFTPHCTTLFSVVCSWLNTQ